MAFVHLALLGGLALGAVPIIIHLLTRRRHKVVRWGAMKYLLEAIEETNKRIQIEDLILLALRVLIVMLLALALARPLLKGEAVSAGPRLAVVLIDNSPSMKARRGGQSRWELAQGWAGKLVKRLPRGSAVAVVPMAGPGGGSAGLRQPTRQMAVARKVLAELSVSARRANSAKALKTALEIASKSDLATRTVYVISDFQAGDWGSEDRALAARLADLGKIEGTSLVAVQCSSGETRNTSVTGLSRAGRIIKVDSPARIAATLQRRRARGESGDAVRDLAAALEVDGEKVDSRAAKLKPGGSKEVIYYASFAKAGDHAVVLRSVPDTSPADDVRYLALEAREEVRVLVVDGDPHPSEDFLSESFYLRFALRPGARALSPIVTKVVEPDSFPGEDLKKYDLVVLANLDRLEVTRVRDLAAYVRSGRALLVFLGDSIDAANYNAGLFGGKEALVRLRLGEVVKGPKDEGGFKIATGKLSDPVMSFFKGGRGGLATANFSRAFAIDLTTTPQAAVPVRLVPGDRPLMVAADVGEGRVAVINTSADVGWSNLPLKPAFTALVQRLVVWLLEPRSRCQNLLPGRPYRLVLPLSAVNRTVTVKRPDGRTAARQPVAAEGRAVVEFTDTEQAGFYEVTWGGEGEAQERRLFSVNVDPAESDLVSVEADAFRQLVGNRELLWLDVTAEAAERAQAGGRELWQAVLLVALALLGLESFLSRRFSGGGR